MKISKLLTMFFLTASFLCIPPVAEAQQKNLSNVLQKLEREMLAKKEKEKKDYKNAYTLGTLTVYRKYLQLYEKESFVPKEHISDIKNRIADYDLWSQAKNKNTISAYNSYLKNTKYNSYANEANDGIAELKSIAEWDNIKKSATIKEINSFLANYPKTSSRSNAQNRIHELTAVDFYKSGKLLNAYRYFDAAGGKHAIARENRVYFDKSEEYYKYTKLNKSSEESILISYLNKYPNSDYYNEVSNMVAITKARKFSMFTGDPTFNSALNYATDKHTRGRVQTYIDSSKNEYAQHKRNQRAAARYANGGTFFIGFEPLDFGWNGISDESDDYFDIYYYNMGLSLKLGNYKDPLQFEVGIKPGLVIIDDGYNDTETKFHMPAYARLKINLFSMDNSKFYVSGIGYYNIVRDKLIENEFSVGGGVGIAWRNWDWHMLYYKQDLEATNGLKNQMLGTSLIYYF